MEDKKKPIKLTLNVETIRDLTFGVRWNPGTENCRPPRLTRGCPSQLGISDCYQCEAYFLKLTEEIVPEGYQLPPPERGDKGD